MKNKCCQKGSLAQKNIKALKLGLEVLNDENRLRILCLLKEHKKLCVCEIFEALDLPQNLVSYHLTKLKEYGFVEFEKQGAKVIYQKGAKGITTFQNLIKIISE
jgi:DNA-binding transcriptional ArsR family regulator